MTSNDNPRDAVNSPPSPIAVSPLIVLGAFAALLADLVAEAEAQECRLDANKFKFIAKFTAMTIDTRGVEDAARFAARIGGLDVVDDPQAVTL
ncbi:hypothetical protein ABIA35_005992 [Catenulispora sp. MAP12-49]|uniref:hypothetical protein n=1 Tax=Catenulispora sp. MAP12-49 TaxID=3156302 RepID=UPI0035185722